MSNKKNDEWLKNLLEREYKINEYAHRIEGQNKRITKLETDLEVKANTIKIMKQGNYIQMGVMIAITISAIIGFIINYNSISKQGEFNKNSLRPWVYDKPDAYLQLKGNYIYCYYTTKCTGNTPAYSVNSYGMLDDKKFYSENEIREAIKKLDTLTTPSDIIHQNEDMYGTDSQTMNISISLRDTLIYLVRENKIFRHSYIEYSDISNNKYALQRTWQFRCKDYDPMKGIFHGTWMLVYTSPKRIR